MDDLEKRTTEALSLLDLNSNYLYFAHQVDIFNTQKEEDLVKTLEHAFPDFEIYNPNQKHNQENYKLWKEKTGSGMNYYYDVILLHMDAGAYLAFQDGMIGAGVFHEMDFLLGRDKSIWEIDWNHDIENVDALDYSRKLSIEETRSRYK